jgi:hypothetical protein
MILQRKKWVNSAEIWFATEADTENLNVADIVEINQSPSKVTGKCEIEFHTLEVDLTKSEEEILLAIKKDTKYEIRRASDKDQLQCQFFENPTPEIIDEFVAFFRSFAHMKGILPIERARLLRYSQAGVAMLSKCFGPNGNPLTWHAYYVEGQRARLLYSASMRADKTSVDRSLVGRANRLNHWNDILYFKNKGLKIYDLGGWYAGDSDKEKLNINKFKEEFGGQHTIQYNGLYTRSIRGKAYVVLRSFYTWIKTRTISR